MTRERFRCEDRAEVLGWVLGWLDASGLREAEERAVPEGTTCIEWLEYHGCREYYGDCLQTGAPHLRGTCDYQVYCDNKLIASGLEPSGLRAYIAARRAIAAAEAAREDG